MPAGAGDLGALLGAPATFRFWIAIAGVFLIGAYQIAQGRSEASDRFETLAA